MVLPFRIRHRGILPPRHLLLCVDFLPTNMQMFLALCGALTLGYKPHG